jgi:hypothetical protein
VADKVAVPLPLLVNCSHFGIPEAVKVGVGVPVAATVKVKRTFAVAVAEFTLLMTGGTDTTSKH